MGVTGIEITDRRESVTRPPRRADRRRSVVILGKPTETNCALATAFADLGYCAQLASAARPPRFREGEVAIARLDVLPTLDGIEPALWRLSCLSRQGVYVMNGPLALFAAHMLSTASSSARQASSSQERHTSAGCQFRGFHLRTW